jgi:hydrogenase maturation factor|tara:strand:- start:75 stop:491 length:417 start_codon:yes stop_codon:yes gene_type:complete
MLNRILLPEGKTTPEMVEEILRQIHSASSQVGVLVIGGHTEVTTGLDKSIVVGHLLCEMTKEALVATSAAEVDDVVLVMKTVGIEGTAIIASELAGDPYDPEQYAVLRGVYRNLAPTLQATVYVREFYRRQSEKGHAQ